MEGRENIQKMSIFYIFRKKIPLRKKYTIIEISKSKKERKNTMNAKQLYEMKPESVTKDLCKLKNMDIDFIPEIREDIDSIETLNERIEIKTVASHVPEWENIWEINTVWFDGTPVMVTQQAGKRGDHERRYLTNKEAFQEMILYIRSLLSGKETWDDDVYDENEDLLELTGFYGYRLEDETGSVVDDSGTEIWKFYVSIYNYPTDMSKEDSKKLRDFVSQVLLHGIGIKKEAEDVFSTEYYFEHKKNDYYLHIESKNGELSVVKDESYHILQRKLNHDAVLEHVLQIFKNMNENDLKEFDN